MDITKTLRLPPDVVHELDALAAAHDRSFSAELRIAAKEYISRENAERLR